MSAFDIVFYLFSLVVLSSACVAVFSRTSTNSSFALIILLLGIGGYYFLLASKFLAILQIILFAGIALLLWRFGLQFSASADGQSLRSNAKRKWVGAILALSLAGIIISTVIDTHWITVSDAPWAANSEQAREASANLPAPVDQPVSEAASQSKEFSKVIYTDYLLPLSMLFVTMVAVAIGGASIVRPRKNTVSSKGNAIEHLSAEGNT